MDFPLGSLIGPLQKYAQLARQQEQDYAYQPQTQAETGYENFLGQFPQRPDHYSPWRKFGAIVAGMGSNNPSQTADEFLNHHYYNAVKDWQARAPWIERAADNERQSNINMRQYTDNLRRNDIAEGNQRINQQRANTYYDSVTSQNAARIAKQDLDERKMQLAIWKRDHPDYQFKVDENGEYIAFNPKDPAAPPVKTGSKASDYSDLEKSQLGLLVPPKDLITARENSAARLKGIPNAPRISSGSGGTGSTMSPTQHTAEENRLAREALSLHPDWAPYIHRDAQGRLIDVSMPKAEAGIFGSSHTTGDPKIMEQANAYIFRSQKPPDARATVLDPQGNPHTILASKLEEFLKDPAYKGWTVKK